MDIDVQAINAQIADHKEQIELLESLKKLAGDPKMRDLLAKFSKNGKSGAGRGKSAITEVVKEASAVEGDSGANRKGELKNTVRAALAAMPDVVFTSGDVVVAMQAKSYKFKASSPVTAVNEVLTSLEKTHEVSLTGEKRGVQKLWQKGSVVVQSRTA